MSWAADYVLAGIQWEEGAQGPNAYDCWSFFRMVQKKHFGIEVPIIIAPDYNDATQLVGLFGNHEERHRWNKISASSHGCGVRVHKPLHVGIWLKDDGGGVLHCVRGVGVIFTHEAAWQMSGFGRKEYYSFAG